MNEPSSLGERDAHGAIDRSTMNARARASRVVDVALGANEERVFASHVVVRALTGSLDAHGYVSMPGSNAIRSRGIPRGRAREGTRAIAGDRGCVLRVEVMDDEWNGDDDRGGDDATASEREAYAPTIGNDWRQAKETIVRVTNAPGKTCAAVIGPKGSGKSTLARFLANAFVARDGACAWLDLDCGRPELTSPGVVSLTVLRAPLLGPAVARLACGAAYAGAPATASEARFVGDTSPQSDPEGYLKGALKCVDAWKAMGDRRPALVVNTHGWVKGLGLELTEEVLRAVGACATECFAVNINSHVASRNAPTVDWFCDDASSRSRPNVRALEVAAGFGTAPKGDDADVEETSRDMGDGAEVKSKDARMSAIDLRALSWLAWAKQTVAMCNDRSSEGALTFEEGGEVEAFNAAAADLMRAPPWKVSLDDIVIHVLHADLPAREALMAINGAVVGLLAAPAPGEDRGLAECVGLGLVRGIDAKNRYVYILTPVPGDKLKAVETLALGKLEFPPRLLGAAGEYPYMHIGTISNIGSGSKAIKSRNNISRAGTRR